MKRTVILLISSALTLAALELGTRIIDGFTHYLDRYDVHAISSIYSAHPELNHTLTPNLDIIRAAHAEINIPAYRLRTNSLGFRFDEHAHKRAKPAGSFRIAVLGDSQVEGYTEETTLPYLLEKALSEHRGARRRIEVMNWGVMSHAPTVYYVNLERNILDYQPDLVILHYDLTDVYDDSVRYKRLAKWDPAGNPVSIRPSGFLRMSMNGRTVSAVQLARERPLYSLRRIRIELLERSKFFVFLHSRTNTLRQTFNLYLEELRSEYPAFAPSTGGGDPLAWCKRPNDPAIKKQIKHSFNVVRSISVFLKKRRIPLLLTTLPHRNHLAPSGDNTLWDSAPLQQIERLAREANVDFRAPTAELRAAHNARRDIYHSDGMHLNDAGREIWAAALAGRIVTRAGL